MTDNPFAVGYVEPKPEPDTFRDDFEIGEPKPKAAVDDAAPKPMADAPLITAPGAYPDITPRQYFAEPCPAPALTNSGINLLDPPARFYHFHPMLGGNVDLVQDSTARRMGNVIHRIALGKGDDYIVSPFDEFRTNEAKAWKREQLDAGLVPMKEPELATAQAVADKLRANIETLTQGLDYETEVVIAWIEQTSVGPIWCRAMIDVWCADLQLGLDLKSCVSAAERDVEKAFANGYARQEAWYRRGLNNVFDGQGRIRFGFLMGEKTAPWLTREVSCSEAFRHGAEFDCKTAIARFSDCMASQRWPGFDPLHVTPPSWLIHKWTTDEVMELTS